MRAGRASVPCHARAAGTLRLGVPSGWRHGPLRISEQQDHLAPERGTLQTDLFEELVCVALRGPADREQLLEIAGPTSAGLEAVLPVRRFGTKHRVEVAARGEQLARTHTESPEQLSHRIPSAEILEKITRALRPELGRGPAPRAGPQGRIEFVHA